MGAVQDSSSSQLLFGSARAGEVLPGMSPAKAFSPPEAEASGRC